MTLANKITIARILLIPVFVLFAVYYGKGVEQGEGDEWQRWAAVAVFLVASITDGLDGWVARRWGTAEPARRCARSHRGQRAPADGQSSP